MLRMLILTIAFSLMINLGCTRIVDEDEARSSIQQQLKMFYASLEQEDEAGLISTIAFDSTIHMPPVQSAGQLINDELSFKNEIEDFFRLNDNMKIWRKNEQIKLIGLGKCAIVTSVNHMEYVKQNNVVSENYFMTIMMEKRGYRWKILHIHQTLLNDLKPAKTEKLIKTPVNIESSEIGQDSLEVK